MLPDTSLGNAGVSLGPAKLPASLRPNGATCLRPAARASMLARPAGTFTSDRARRRRRRSAPGGVPKSTTGSAGPF